MLRKHPKLYETYLNRGHYYEQTIDLIRNAPKEVKIIEVNPPSSFKTKSLTTNKRILRTDYQSGYQIGLELIKKWQL